MVLTVRSGAGDYPVHFREGGLAEVSSLFDLARRVLIVTDTGVPAEYADRLAAQCGLPVIERIEKVDITEQVFKANTARHITNMLQGVMTGGTGVEAQLGAQVAAGKTGTTSDEYDRWFCGFTPYYVCTVWTGYDMPSYMYYSGNPAAQIWKRVMTQIHAALPAAGFNEPTYWGAPTNIFGDLTEKQQEEEQPDVPDPVIDPVIPPMPTPLPELGPPPDF